MSPNAIDLAPRRRVTSFRSRPASPATIIEDLRAFAREIGVPGFSGLSKDELVETLRQRYVLEQIRSGARG